MMTVRNIPDEVHAILEDSVKSEGRIKLGSMLAEIGRQAKLTDEEFAVIEQVRDKTLAKPVSPE